MIVVDASPLVAILKQESDAELFSTVMQSAQRLVIGAPTKLEMMMVASGRLGVEGSLIGQQLLDSFEIFVEPWTEAMADMATAAFVRFGKGRHPAKLNFGDCMAYALAKSLDAPLLYKGGDFAKTDIRSALT